MKTPKDWQTSNISALTILRKGKKPVKLSFKKFPDCVSYLDIVAIEKGIINQYADSYSTLLSSETDLFVVADGSRSGLVGKGAAGAVGSTLLCITPLGIDSTFLYYFLKLKYDDLNKNTTGASIPHLNIDLFTNLVVSFPSIEEQKRIVVELIDQLNELENDFSNANIELERLSQFRKSILNEAVNGKLWSTPNDINPKTNLPQAWKIVTISDLSTFVGSGITPKGGSTNYKESGVPFIRSQNVYPDELRLNDVAYITSEMHAQMKRTHLKAKDVLLNITGASIGRSVCLPENFTEGNVNQHVCIIRTSAEILPEYLSLFLNSPTGQDNINSLQKGVTRQGLNYDQIKAIKIHLPSLDDQQRIIEHVAMQNRSILELESQHSTKLDTSNTVEKAVLQMAFEGYLSAKLPGDSDPKEILLNSDKVRKEKIEDFAKIKLIQSKKSVNEKVIFDKKTLIEFITEKFKNKEFTSQELYTSLKVDNGYNKFNELFFDLLKNDDNNSAFLEAIYDTTEQRQMFKIKEV